MWLKKANLNIWTHGQYHALKTQRIGYEKTYGSKKKETRNYKRPHTINASNVGSSRDLISQIRETKIDCTGHAFKCLGCPCPATFIICVLFISSLIAHGVTAASWFVRSFPDRAVWVRVLGTLCCVLGQDTLLTLVLLVMSWPLLFLLLVIAHAVQSPLRFTDVSVVKSTAPGAMASGDRGFNWLMHYVNTGARWVPGEHYFINGLSMSSNINSFSYFPYQQNSHLSNRLFYYAEFVKHAKFHKPLQALENRWPQSCQMLQSNFCQSRKT